MSIATIPIIDLNYLKTGDYSQVLALAKQLHQHFSDVGFVYITNHGISGELVDELEGASRKFFALQHQEKMQISMTHAAQAWRGYFPVGAELTAGKVDQKEGLYFGTQDHESHLGVQQKWPMHGKNLYPAQRGFETYGTLIENYVESMSLLGHALMELVALGLGLERDYFRRRFLSEPTRLFRVFHYPAHQQASEQWGVGEHTDMGFLTILYQDHIGGLEVQGANGQWLNVPPLEGTFVINIGDMLQYWTHGIYKATLHRVRNVSAQGRISMPFFFDPGWQAELHPIEPQLLRGVDLAQAKLEPQTRQWDGLDWQALHPGLTYGEFVWNKIKGSVEF